MEQRIAKLRNYFDQQISLCTQQEQNLRADERTDEAVFERVKAKQHDDAVQMQIEQNKLDTIAEIKETFEKIWEEES